MDITVLVSNIEVEFDSQSTFIVVHSVKHIFPAYMQILMNAVKVMVSVLRMLPVSTALGATSASVTLDSLEMALFAVRDTGFTATERLYIFILPKERQKVSHIVWYLCILPYHVKKVLHTFLYKCGACTIIAPPLNQVIT